MIEVRASGIHGSGVYATQPIAKGVRIIEMLGERITDLEADLRYPPEFGTVALFSIGPDDNLDCFTNGNEARFINHSCDPNCRADVEGGRVFIHALHDIEVGDELTFDYALERADDDPPDVAEHFPCYCNTCRCRGTMLAGE